MDDQPGQIVVGWDGATGSIAAVEWAAAEAARRQVPMIAMHVADFGTSDEVGGYLPWRSELILRVAQQLADDAVDRARAVTPDAEVEARAVIGNVSHQLIELSRDAALVVVGTRGHGQLADIAMGSVTYTVSGHARCPVIVVRGTDTRLPGPGRPVVVGVDGSGHSGPCIAFAAGMAHEAGAPLLIVTAYRSVTTYAVASSPPTALEADGHEEFRTREQVAEQIVSQAAVQARAGRDGLDVRTRVMDGTPAASLALAASGCALLVVGSRGRGGFEGLLLGSVSHTMLHIAPCPVAVLRA